MARGGGKEGNCKNGKQEVLEIEHEVNKAAEKVFSTYQKLPGLNQDEEDGDFDTSIPQVVGGAHLAKPQRKRKRLKRAHHRARASWPRDCCRE